MESCRSHWNTRPLPFCLALLFFLSRQHWATTPLPRSHSGGSTVAKREKPGKGLVHPSEWGQCHGLHQAFLGRAASLVLLPPCMEPSFSNLFSALKLISEAASGSASKTKWLSQAEKHRSQMHACAQGCPAVVQPWSFPACLASSQHPLLSTHKFCLPAHPPSQCPGVMESAVQLGQGHRVSEPSLTHIHSEIPHPHKKKRSGGAWAL